MADKGTVSSRLASRVRSEGGRVTAQRVVVAQALLEAKQAVSATELHRRLRSRYPRLGLATVYRALEAQVAHGMARRLERSGHVYAYVACAPEHHHHLVCVGCQRVEDVDETLVRPMLGAIGRRHAFQVDHARLDYYGMCARCAATTRGAEGRGRQTTPRR